MLYNILSDCRQTVQKLNKKKEPMDGAEPRHSQHVFDEQHTMPPGYLHHMGCGLSEGGKGINDVNGGRI